MLLKRKKHHLSHDEEFQIMKLILDKFLWIAAIIMLYGFYRLVSSTQDMAFSIILLLIGALIMIIFGLVLLKEFNFK